MGKKYKELKYEERITIWKLHRLGMNQSQIAKEIDRNRSVVCRELTSNWSNHFDSIEQAQEAEKLSRERKSRRGRKAKLKNEQITEYVEEKLKAKWSPELIAGRLSIDRPGQEISHQTIYNYIYTDHPELKEYLRFGKRKRKLGRKKRSKKYRKIPDKKPISERPTEVNDRSRLGDWEIDTIVSGAGGHAAILVATERKTRASFLKKLNNKDSIHLKEALVDIFTPLPPYLKKTFTFDNGGENAMHSEIDSLLKTSSYFCEPYHSWEKGTVENRIGVIRSYFPKGTNFDNINDNDVLDVQNLINSRPLKLFNFNSPGEELSVAITLLI